MTFGQDVGERHRIYSITVAMREVLIEHLDGVKVPVIVSNKGQGLLSHESARRLNTTNSLILRGFVRRTKSGKHTVITYNGRLMLSKLLADYADALVRTYQMLGVELSPDWIASLTGSILVEKSKVLGSELV